MLSKLEKNKDFSFLHMHIASLNQHKEELEAMLLNQHKEELEAMLLILRLTCGGLTETKIKKDYAPIFDININRYKCFHTPTESEGTLQYLKVKINCKPRKDLYNGLNQRGQLESTLS